MERLETAHLEAAHAQRVEWMKERVVTPPLGVYQDFRAILHIHAEDADHTKGTRAEVLKAAREADVQVVMFTDHRGPKPETWHGIREGVLFIPGSEDDHELRYPSPLLQLRFLSHLEERPDMPAEGFQGMEIYNRHTDAKDHKEFNEYIQSAMKQSREWHHLVEKRKQFPDEVFAAATGPLPLFLARWDREIAVHPFTGIGANDAHQNQIFNGVTFDPYAVAFRHTSTHILARELTEPEIRSSLAAGHVYVAHDWLCDPAGFSYVAQNNLGVFDMGDTVPMLNNTHLEARFPIPAKIKLIRNGVVVAEATGSKLDFVAKEEGAYRLEAWLAIDGESDLRSGNCGIDAAFDGDLCERRGPQRYRLHRRRAGGRGEAQARSIHAEEQKGLSGPDVYSRRQLADGRSVDVSASRQPVRENGDRRCRPELSPDAHEPASGADRGCGGSLRLGV